MKFKSSHLALRFVQNLPLNSYGVGSLIPECYGVLGSMARLWCRMFKLVAKMISPYDCSANQMMAEHFQKSVGSFCPSLKPCLQKTLEPFSMSNVNNGNTVYPATTQQIPTKPHINLDTIIICVYLIHIKPIMQHRPTQSTSTVGRPNESGQLPIKNCL